MSITNDLLVFAAGCAFAAFGGEFFVRGLVGVARMARLPMGVVAATLGAFATSSPELIVGITSALRGVPEISFGDVTGSNIVNIALILAIPIALFGLAVSREAAFRDTPFALAIFPILFWAARDGVLSRDDAKLFLAVFALWLVFVLISAMRNRAPADSVGAETRGRVYAMTVAGLAALFIAGQLIVLGATGLATAAQLPPFLIGATIVALGTSVPELATVVVSSIRGHQDVGLQTILGSNIFNTLFIIPVAALIHPISATDGTLWLTLGTGLLVTLIVVPLSGYRLGRSRGLLLFAIYAAFVAINGYIATSSAH